MDLPQSLGAHHLFSRCSVVVTGMDPNQTTRIQRIPVTVPPQRLSRRRARMASLVCSIPRMKQTCDSDDIPMKFHRTCPRSMATLEECNERKNRYCRQDKLLQGPYPSVRPYKHSFLDVNIGASPGCVRQKIEHGNMMW